MAVSPTPPQLTPLPPAPLPTDAEAVFDAKAGVRLTAEEVMVTEQNAALAWQAGSMAETKGYKEAAATSAGNAADSATLAGQKVVLAAEQVGLAANQVGLATTQANNAAASAATATAMAQAAGAAVGPPPVPNKFLGTDSAGNVAWRDAGQKIGDTLVTADTPGATYLKGLKTYLQSAYPDLFAVLGLLTDGPQLTARALPPTGSLTFSSIAYGNGIFVMAVGTPNSSDCYTSTDGINWTVRALGTSGGWVVKFINSKFVMMPSASTSAIKTSTDGITWTGAGTSPVSVKNITYGAGVYVLLTASGLVYTSPDLVTWTARTFPLNGGVNWEPLAFANGIFVAVAGTGQVNTSTDGITWTYRVTLANRSWTGIAYGNSIFMLIGNGYAARSVDGLTWEQLPQNSLLVAAGVTFGAGVFATAKATPSTSKDGDFWVSRGTAPSGVEAVAYGAGLFVGVGSGTSGGVTFPFANYDTASQFYVPLLVPAQQGFTGYVKARLS